MTKKQDAEVVGTWIENGHACLALRVDEGEGAGVVEYVGRVPLAPIHEDDPDWEILDDDGRQEALVAAAKAQRDAQRSASGPVLKKPPKRVAL